MKQLKEFLDGRGIKNVENYHTAAATSFRIGGIAAMAVFPDRMIQLTELLSYLGKSNLPFRVLGNASNMLFAFERYEGVLIFTRGMSDIRCRNNTVTCECGASLASLASTAAEKGLAGLEFAHGIPGTVGGAVFMNAGAYGSSVSEALSTGTAYDCETDEIIHLSLTQHEFRYRSSIYHTNPKLICLEACFLLTPDDPEAIRERMRANLEARREKQPLTYPSAGSYFKRPEGHFAGKLIEDAGLKGRRVGGAQVSEKHAGFLINCGGATAEDVLVLEELVRSTVYDRFGVLLEREVEVLS